MALWEGNGGGHPNDNPNVVPQTNTDNGPFNAEVWNYWGYVDPWGLPKITIYQTTYSGGQPGCAIKVGDKWVHLVGKSSGAVMNFLNRLKSAYQYTELG